MLFDKFKKIIKSDKEDKKAAPKKKEAAVKPAVKKAVSKPAVKKHTVPVYEIIRHPLITEKGGLLGEQNKYVMKVYSDSNKFEIKKAVGALYNVTVEKVHIVNLPRKKRQRGRSIGYKQGLKKAIVTLKQGDKIDFS